MPLMVLSKKDQLIPHLPVLDFFNGLLVSLGGIDIQLNEGSDLSLNLLLFHHSSPFARVLARSSERMKTG
jgi:hypothetical protein